MSDNNFNRYPSRTVTVETRFNGHHYLADVQVTLIRGMFETEFDGKIETSEMYDVTGEELSEFKFVQAINPSALNFRIIDALKQAATKKAADDLISDTLNGGI